jgi:hypothetical protein
MVILQFYPFFILYKLKDQSLANITKKFFRKDLNKDILKALDYNGKMY